MSEPPNLNIKNYSIEELLNILDIDYPINQEQLLEHGKTYIEKYIAESQPEYAGFFAKALEKLINNFDDIEKNFDYVEKDFAKKTGWLQFLANCTSKWIEMETKKKIKNFFILDYWIFR